MEFDGKLHLLLYGPEIINRESQPIEPSELGFIPRLMEYMVKVMQKCNTKGLSAPQVGVFKSFIVYERLDHSIVGLINPSVERMLGKELNVEETCLCIPPIENSCRVPRMEIVMVRAFTADKPNVEKHLKLVGQDSLIVQRELDHLTGTFFVDRVPSSRRREVLEKYENWKTKWESAGKPFPY